MEIIAAAIAGALLALAAAWLLWARGLAAARAESIDYRIRIGGHAVEVHAQQARLAELAEVERTHAVVAAELAGLKAQQTERDAGHARQLADLQTSFALLAAKALDGAQTAFLERAEARFAEHKTLSETGMAALLAPVAETLTRYEGELM